MLRSRLVAGAFLAAFLAFCGGCGYVVHLRSEVSKRDRQLVALDLERAGLKASLAVKPKEVIQVVEKIIPKEVIRTIKESSAEPIVGTKTEAVSNPFELPLNPFPPDGEPVDEVRHSQPFQFGVTFGLVILDSVGDQVQYAGSVSGRVFSTDPPFSMPLTFDKENVHIEVALSNKVKRAINEYNRPWIKKHTSLNCPGVGLGYSLESQKLTTFVGCTYGLSWF